MMQKSVLGAAFALAGLGLMGVGAARADDRPGGDWMTISQIAHELTEQGFTNIGKIEADDGHWEAEAVRDGRMQKVRLDPYSGKLLDRGGDRDRHDRDDRDHDDD